MAGLTKEQIFKAADQIFEKGETPTLANVRALIGSGSFSTISEAMKEWRAVQAKPTTPIKEAAPEAVSERLEALGAEIWAIALEMANSRLKSEREALEAARMDMEAAQQETAEMADQMATEIEQLRDEIKNKDALIDVGKTNEESLRNMWSAEQDETIKLTAQITEANKRIDDLKDEITNARAELSSTRNDLVKYVERDREQTAKIAQLEAEQGAFNKEITKASNERDDARKEAKAAEKAANTAKVEAATLRGENETLRSQINQLNALFEKIGGTEQKEQKPSGRKKDGVQFYRDEPKKDEQ